MRQRLLSTAFVDANLVTSRHVSPSTSKENQPTTLQVTDHDCALSRSLEDIHNNTKQYLASTSISVSSSCSMLLSFHIPPCPPPFPPSRHSRSCLPTRDGCYLSVPRRCPTSFQCGARSVVSYDLEPRAQAIKSANVATRRAPSQHSDLDHSRLLDAHALISASTDSMIEIVAVTSGLFSE